MPLAAMGEKRNAMIRFPIWQSVGSMSIDWCYVDKIMRCDVLVQAC